MHAWASSVELFHSPGTEQAPWVKVSETGTVTYRPATEQKTCENIRNRQLGIPVKQ